MILIWIKFIFCTLLIVFSGYKLSIYGDIIAEKTGLGRTWIGVILMAGVTSLPELITGISSVTIAHAPDIALGDIMGSSVFNILIIALLDLLYGTGPIFSKANHGHIISGGFGIILLAISVISIFIYSGSDSLGTGYIGLYVPFIMGIYLLSMRTIYRFERKKIVKLLEERAATFLYKGVSTKKVYLNYGINALIIIITGTWLPFIGSDLASATGWGGIFVGNIFVALSTSLPELVVSITALRIGAVDMAIANLLGSNLFNMNILAIDDLFYTKGPLLSDVSLNHLVSGLSAIIMTAIAVIGLTYRSERKTFVRVSWDALGIITIYGLNAYVLYSLIGM